MDYYGQGNSSNEGDRTSYLYDDLTTDVNAAFEPARFLRLGLTGGFVDSHVGSGQRGGVPSIEERFDQATAPGLEDDPAFARWGAFVDFRSPGHAERSSQRRRVRRALSTVRRSRPRPLQLPPGGVRGAALPAVLQQDARDRAARGDGPVVSDGGSRGALLPAADARRQRQPARLPALPVLRRSRRLFQRRAPLARFHRARHGHLSSTPAK